MKKSPVMKFFVIIVLVFFILATGLTFVLYLASPSTVLELENQEVQEVMEEEVGTIEVDELSLEDDMIETIPAENTAIDN